MRVDFDKPFAGRVAYQLKLFVAQEQLQADLICPGKRDFFPVDAVLLVQKAPRQKGKFDEVVVHAQTQPDTSRLWKCSRFTSSIAPLGQSAQLHVKKMGSI